jgi:hypothetical protein
MPGVGGGGVAPRRPPGIGLKTVRSPPEGSSVLTV